MGGGVRRGREAGGGWAGQGWAGVYGDARGGGTPGLPVPGSPSLAQRGCCARSLTSESTAQRQQAARAPGAAHVAHHGLLGVGVLALDALALGLTAASQQADLRSTRPTPGAASRHIPSLVPPSGGRHSWERPVPPERQHGGRRCGGDAARHSQVRHVLLRQHHGLAATDEQDAGITHIGGGLQRGQSERCVRARPCGAAPRTPGGRGTGGATTSLHRTKEAACSSPAWCRLRCRTAGR